MGVRGSLLLAFLSVSMFSLVAAVTGILSLSQVGQSLDDITEHRVPEALAWLELSRSIERVVQVAPVLLSATTEERRAEVSADMFGKMEALSELLNRARQYGEVDGQEKYMLDGAIDVSLASDRAVELVNRINDNFVAIDAFVGERLQLLKERSKVRRQLARGNSNAQRVLTPGTRIINFQTADWVNSSAVEPNAELSLEQAELARSIIASLPQQRAAVMFDAFNRELLSIADADTAEQVDLLGFPVQGILDGLEAEIAAMPKRMLNRLSKQVQRLRDLSVGPGSLPEIRKSELIAVAQAKELLALNTRLSSFLANRTQTLVTAANQRIEVANTTAIERRILNRNILSGVVVLSIVSSLLIVWLYVGRSLTARLTALSDSMMAISNGDLRAALPSGEGRDEISRMAKALVVFRDTAIEVEESNLREIATARQRLIDAIESINEGFAFYDAEDRLVLSNQRYKDLLYDGQTVDLTPGTTFESILRNAVDNGMIAEAHDDPETWLEGRMERHRNPGQPLLQQRSDNRWVMVSERRVTGGGAVAIYSDLTELKQREDQLSHANQQIMSSVHYASRIQEAMLPSRHALGSILPDHFLIWEPRDIVGGDFFWCHETNQGAYIIVGDCTGHGVPGAFMTLIACGLIDRHLRTNDTMKPSELLSAMHADLRELLGQNEKNSETDDGLEAGICFIERSGGRMTFAGSRFSLFAVTEDEINEIKGDKAGIGYHRYSADTQFTDTEITANANDRYIMATDGLFDQVGGAKRRGYGKLRLRAFIDAHRNTTITKQGDALRETLAEYQGDEYRRDDLTVLGFQIPSA
ncbi:hypothetical protein A9Q94_00540 [Rhodobacterales bacterium 56_14_T64]|nr:hypothetical protein A9Q94_00540 [Rhodobacterales bacterium 56_14_T64]